MLGAKRRPRIAGGNCCLRRSESSTNTCLPYSLASARTRPWKCKITKSSSLSLYHYTRLSSILHSEDGSEPEELPFTLGPKAKVNPKYILTDHLWQYLQDYAAKHRAKGNGFGFGLVGPDDTSRTLSARYHKDGSEILISRGSRNNPRRLTPRECARLMGWPDSFVIPVSDTPAYRQFGNSVAVPVVSEVARLMRACLPSIHRRGI